jgi:hypothetical protein
MKSFAHGALCISPTLVLATHHVFSWKGSEDTYVVTYVVTKMQWRKRDVPRLIQTGTGKSCVCFLLAVSHYSSGPSLGPICASPQHQVEILSVSARGKKRNSSLDHQYQE